MNNNIFISIILMSLLALPMFSMAQSALTAISDSDLSKMTDSEKLIEIYKATTTREDLNSKNTYNIVNKMKYGISITGTDYDLNEDTNFTVCTKVHDIKEPINNAFCDAQIFYPNLTDIFMSFSMSYISGSRGLYCQSDRLANFTGIYPIDVECIKPVNSSSQNMYFRRETQFSDLFLLNNTGSTTSTIDMLEVGSQNYACFPDRFKQNIADFNTIAFIENITDIFGYFSKSGSNSEYSLNLNFFRHNPYGQTHLGTSIRNNVTLSTAVTKFTFNSIQLNAPFSSDDFLEVEVCVKSNDANFISDNVFFSMNSTSRNSSFIVNSKIVNSTLDFIVQGSSELNVKNSTLTINQNTNTNHFSLLNILNANFTTAFNKLDQIINMINGHDISMANNFTNTNSIINTQFSGLNSNILGNFTFINSKIDSLSNNMASNFTAFNNSISSQISQLSSDMSSLLNSLLYNIGRGLGTFIGGFP